MGDDSSPVKDFYIPKYIFNPEDEREDISPPSCPVLVFINTRSGGQLGGQLLETYVELLGEFQVFDLGKQAPEVELQTVFGNLESLKHSGDELAEHILNNLNLIVAGGDGTASWLLGVVCDLKLARPPPVATIPLGTGNNLPFSFGWGKKNPRTDRSSVLEFLEKVKNAEKMNIDNWHLVMRMKASNEGSSESVVPLELPHSLHSFTRKDSFTKEDYLTFRGGFWNYFSMGMDAQVSHAFHSQRKKNPEKFKNQLINQSTYLKLAVSQGTFAHDKSGSISQLAEIDVKKNVGDEWTTLKIPHNIKSIICLNLPSFSGGLNPWGVPNKKPKYREFTPPYVDDGRIEVVGFKDAWQGLLLLFNEGHGTRLAQANRIRFRFHKGGADHTHMRMDGEPWVQPLKANKDSDDRVTVEISHHGQVSMLAGQNSRSRSMSMDNSLTPGTPSTPSTPLDDGSSDEDAEERRKFGAADTFKYPEDIDISHLS